MEDDTNPRNVFRKYYASLVDAISEPMRLANDLGSAGLISSTDSRELVYTTGRSDYEKVSRILNRVHRLLSSVKGDDQKEIMRRFLDILQFQDTPVSLLAKEILDASGILQDPPQSDSAKDNSTFLQSVHHGSGEMKYTVVTLNGPPGAGKTSVKQLLLGRAPLPKELQNSTNIMKSIRTNRITTDGYSVFNEITDKDILEMLKGKVNHENVGLQNVDASSAFSIEPKSSLPMDRPTNDLFNLKFVFLIDSGGQPQFSDLLPFLFHHQSLHIVVFRLTDGLEDKPPIRYIQNGQEYTFPKHLSLTNIEYIERTCEIAEAVERSTGFVSAVLVVGTHLDKLPGGGDEENQLLQKMNEKLYQDLYRLKKYHRYLVLKSDTKHQVIHPINAMVHDMKKRLENASFIQNQLLIAAPNNSFTVPKRWLAFQVDLAEERSVMHFEECCEQGKKFGMNATDVKNALKFFKRVGLILYYPDSGSDLVFTKLDPLINRLSTLLRVSFNPPEGIAGGHVELREKGLFDEILLGKVMRLEHISEKVFKNVDFLTLISHLKVTCKLRVLSTWMDRVTYFMPSALALTKDSNPFEISNSSCNIEFSSPLVASYNESILPPGFFMMLVMQLVDDESRIFDYNSEVIQYRNAVLLAVKKTDSIAGGGLMVVDKKRWVEFSYTQPSQAHSCPSLLKIISHAIENTRKTLVLTTHKLSFGFLCMICGVEDHICLLSECYSSVHCTKNPSVTKIFEEKPHWLKVLNEGVPGITSTVEDLPLREGEVTFKVSERELDEHLRGLVDAWERFALHLPRISLADIAAIKRNNPLNISNQKISLYEKWLRLFPQASWDNVIDALEKAEEYNLAKQIRTKLQEKTVAVAMSGLLTERIIVPSARTLQSKETSGLPPMKAEQSQVEEGTDYNFVAGISPVDHDFSASSKQKPHSGRELTAVSPVDHDFGASSKQRPHSGRELTAVSPVDHEFSASSKQRPHSGREVTAVSSVDHEFSASSKQRPHSGRELTAVSPVDHDFSASSKQRPHSDITYKDLLLKELEKKDVLDILRQKSARWKDFAIALNVNDNFCDDLTKAGPTLSPYTMLDAVLEEWIESQCSDVTWQKVIDVLKELNLKRTAREVGRFLEQDKIKLKYFNREDFCFFF